jgi:hypothetical protein
MLNLNEHEQKFPSSIIRYHLKINPKKANPPHSSTIPDTKHYLIFFVTGCRNRCRIIQA